MNESPSLAAWLQRIEQLHPHSIEMGLERIRPVYERLQLPTLPPVISVAGTNGKGSVVAACESVLHHAGYRVGAYTSPHLLHYCERVRVATQPIEDSAMISAFEAVEQARRDVALTYFEFGTLAALYHLAHARLDAIVLEVGMGGRLDAVNIVDADVVVITPIGLDHQQWLGDTVAQIAVEKAGIMRPGRPAVCAMAEPPPTLLETALDIGATVLQAGASYDYTVLDNGDWRYRDADGALKLPPPGLPGTHQYGNAAAAVCALRQLAAMLPLDNAQMAAGVSRTTLAGRQQLIQRHPDLMLDVAHNADSARALADTLQSQPVSGRTLVVFSVLADKDISAMAAPLAPLVDGWYLAPSVGPRGVSAGEIRQRLAAAAISQPMHTLQSVEEALRAAQREAVDADRIVVCGSFLTVAAAAAALHPSG
ncbi:MAG: bifunctional tetrahydrofolate synthase/dihydrofolate synthase [Wenzhouxiangellaceae bacterium]